MAILATVASLFFYSLDYIDDKKNKTEMEEDLLEADTHQDEN